MSRKTKRWLLIAAAIAGVMGTASFVMRDRFSNAATAVAVCGECTTREKAGVAIDAFRDPERFGAIPQIVGGHPTDASEFPAVGAILRNGTLSCTGTLIAPRTVLTAAHCVAGFVPTSLSFQLGLVVDPARPGIVGSGSAVPNQPPLVYRPRTSTTDPVHDIGLLFLSSDPAPTLTRPTYSAGPPAIAVNSTVEKVGYGFSVLKPRLSGDGRQRAIKVQINSVEPFRFKHGKQGRSICNRDSGGPGLIAGTIVGVTSTTGSCAKGTDTRVAPFFTWINDRKL